MQWTIVPTAALLAFSQFTAFHDDFRNAVAGAIAGVVAMIPEGLVLLTSLAFALAAVTLARRRVLVQELPAVEGLARVDVVMLDKTGTITEGAMRFDDLEVLADGRPVAAALGALAADEDRNGTMQAVAEAFAAPADWTRTGAVPFSSARKWSAATFDTHGTWVFGAPEMVWVGRPADDPVRRRAEELAAAGRRVVLLAHTERPLDGETLPAPLDAAAFVMFDEKIRPDAAETLGYFAAQGVDVQSGVGRQPANGRRDRGRVSASRVRPVPSMVASSPTIRWPWASCSSRPRSSAG